MQAALLGLDIGGTKSAALVGDTDGNVIARQQWPSNAQRGPDPMLDELTDHAHQLLREHPTVERVGVAIGGPVDCDAGVVYSPPNLPGWNAIDLRQRLAAALGLPVSVEHDAAACAMAEARWGIGRELGDAPTLIYLTCGTGFGAGLVLRGKPWHGSGGRSPEVGHVRLAADGPVAFGKRGSAEAFCAGSSLPRIAAWRFPSRWANSPPDGPQLKQLWDGGDDDAAAVIALNASMTARVCAMLADLLIPDAIALGSLAQHLGERWVEQVRRAFEAEVLPDVAARCRIGAAQLGDRLQDLSTLAAAMRSPMGKVNTERAERHGSW